ncbi:MAG: DUF998 domain-containing protein [Pseudonocardia sp.]
MVRHEPGYPVGGNFVSPYSPISQPISGLGLGATAPYMNTAFVLSGLLLLAGLIGVLHSAVRPCGRRVPRRSLAVQPPRDRRRSRADHRRLPTTNSTKHTSLTQREPPPLSRAPLAADVSAELCLWSAGSHTPG